MVHIWTVGLPHTVYVYISTYQSTSSRCQSQRAYDWYSFVIDVRQQLPIDQKNVSASTTSRKEKMKQVSFWPSPFAHAVVMALVAAIVRRLTLTILDSDVECHLLTFNRLLVVFCHILSTTGE